MREIIGKINSLVLKKQRLLKAFTRFKELQNECMDLIDKLERSGIKLMDKGHLLASDLSDSSL